MYLQDTHIALAFRELIDNCLVYLIVIRVC